MNKIKNSFVTRYGMVWMIIVIFLVFSALLPGFGSMRNVNVFMVGRVSVGFFALASMVPLAAGEFDISLGYMLGAAIMVGGKISTFGASPAVILLCTLLAGILLGAFNGFLSVYLGIPSTISTLGTGMVFQGISIFINNSKSISSVLPRDFTIHFKTAHFGLNLSVWLLILSVIVLWYVMEKTPYGKQTYAVGQSRKVAYLAGIDTNFIRFMSFVVAGIMIGLGAMLVLGTSGNAYPDTGPTYLMPGLATVFLSITCHKIGRYNVVGTFCALVLLSVVFAGAGQLGTPFWFEGVVNGIILLGVVLMNGKDSRQMQVG